MLKKIAIASLITSGLVFPSIASASIESALANICEIVKVDDKSELRKKMKNVQSSYSIRLKDYYDGISCSGNSLLRVAALNNSVETASLIVKKMPKSMLEAPEQDGKTLLGWVAENGLDASPVAQVVKERI